MGVFKLQILVAFSCALFYCSDRQAAFMMTSIDVFGHIVRSNCDVSVLTLNIIRNYLRREQLLYHSYVV